MLLHALDDSSDEKLMECDTKGTEAIKGVAVKTFFIKNKL